MPALTTLSSFEQAVIGLCESEDAVKHLEDEVNLNEDHTDVYAVRERLNAARHLLVEREARVRKFSPEKGHTEACQKGQREFYQWMKDHPNHCPVCLGVGYVEFHDNVPYGSTTADLVTAEDCECVMEGKCPLCGKMTVVGKEGGDSEYRCTDCGWATDEGNTVPVLECFCDQC